ncbi:OmpA family protein [bacterium]|nr:OmpA family protein [bacterium]
MTHNKIKHTTCIAVIALLSITISSFAQMDNTLESARAAGIGGAYLAIGDDVNSVASNSAGLMRLNRTQLTGSYTRYFSGANIPTLQEGSIYFSPFEWTKWFFAIGASYFNHDIYNQQIGSLVIGRELFRKGSKFRLATAVNANLYRIDYNNLNFSPDFDPNDPVFSGGYDKMTYGADISLLAEIGPLSIGAKGYNLNEPEISLRTGAEGGKLIRKVRGGLAYDILGIITPVVEVEVPVSSTTSISDEMSFAVGAESWFVNKMLGARAGFNSQISSDNEIKSSAISLGMSFRSRTDWDAGLDYAIQIPIDSPVEMGQTHKVSVGIGMKRPERVITDLAVVPNSVNAVPEHVIPGQSVQINAKIENLGDMDAQNFPMSLYYFVDGKPYIACKITIDELVSGDRKDVTLDFTPVKGGQYELFASVNDQGDKAPAVHNKVLEYDLENNTWQTSLACYGPPVFDGNISTSKDQLSLSTVSKVKEEAPMVPIVFFEKTSTVIKQSRFDTMLRTIAERLLKNPGATIELKGHYDAKKEIDGGKELALSRARAVKKYFTDLGVSADKLIVVEDGYDMGAELVKNASAEFRDEISEENRNVDISVRLDESEYVCEYYYSEEQIEPSEIDYQGCVSTLETMVPFLEANPDVNVVFMGVAGCSESDCIKEAYDRAIEFRKRAQKALPNWLEARLFVLASDWVSQDEFAKVELLLDGDAIIFRPRGSASGREALEFEDIEEMQISIDPIKSEVGIDSFAIFISEDNSEEPFAILKTGKGETPSTISWNWLGSFGQPPDPEKTYFAEIYAEDIYGQSVTGKSKPISVKVKEQEERREMFIISFNFGKAEATSQYLEARVEALADRLIERAKFLGSNVRIKATVIGHTDIVGSPKANKELSLERAKKEYTRLQYGMMHILGMNSIDELDGWLKDHRVELGYEGRSFEEPMTIRYWEQGYWRSEQIGDNEVPEGRLVNRRVVLEVLTLSKQE